MVPTQSFSGRLGGLRASLHVVRREKSLALGGIQIPVHPLYTLVIILCCPYFYKYLVFMDEV
jgi:hypothetical protein